MRNHLTIIIACLSWLGSFAQGELNLKEGWEKYTIPRDLDTIISYNKLGGDWVVYRANNKVFVSLKSQYKAQDTLPFNIVPTESERWLFRGRRSFLKVDDGYLVAFYKGEFGGSVYWFSADGLNRLPLSYKGVRQFFQRDNKIYAIEGLAHLSISEGSIIELYKTGGNWKDSLYITMPNAPYVAAIDDSDNIIVITSHGLYSIDRNRKIETLVHDGFWEGFLYPNSLVVDKGIVYSGMRHGVWKYNLRTHHQEWLMKH